MTQYIKPKSISITYKGYQFCRLQTKEYWKYDTKSSYKLFGKNGQIEKMLKNMNKYIETIKSKSQTST